MNDTLKQVKHHLMAFRAMEKANLSKAERAKSPHEKERFRKAAEVDRNEAETLLKEISEAETQQAERESKQMASERAMSPDESTKASTDQ